MSSLIRVGHFYISNIGWISQNSIFFHSYSGSFCWSQNAVLLQCTKVEAIKWTGSGDGIVSGGIDVILWRRRNRSWEIAWKFKRDEPQNLVSATWSIEGPSATAARPNNLLIKESSSESKCVLVCYGDSISEYEKFELRHPQPVLMIQWRPPTERQPQRDAKYLVRNMLLTCCLDGTARLWTEVDNGKVRKFGKENNDRKTTRKFFCVAAVIEINQVLNGNLGMDIFLNWAIESRGIYRTGEDINQFFSTERYRHGVGRCEWLIGFGPGTVITFWAVHCLDDVSPMRFPRVTLWKRQELHGADFSKFKDSLLLNKVIILRNCLSGPPEICSLVHLLPCNSLIWSLLHTQRSGDDENSLVNSSTIYKYSSCSAVQNGGHGGKILEVAMHPYIYELQLAASLDSNGLILFWFVSTMSNCNPELSTLTPTWKICGKFATHDSFSKYTSLKWSPSVSDEDRVLLMGHVGGIDCFVVKLSQIEGGEDIICHFICTIPLTGHGPYEDNVLNIFAIPLPSTCNKTFRYNKFMLLGVSMKSFEALSWEVTLHSYDLPESTCGCNFDDQNSHRFTWKFENTFANKRYCLGVNPCSSQFPEPYSHDQITSFSMVGPGNLIPTHEKLEFDRDSCCSVPAYIMATGFSDGSLKLWRSNPSKLPTPHNQIPWELVGKFVAHQGPVNSICLTDCGQKIATISAGSNTDGTSILHIWGSINLIGAGSFVLEDILSIDGDVVALKWLALGNGQLFLGVCTHNNLQVYAQKHSGGQTVVNLGKSLNLKNWSCIAVTYTLPAIHDLLWGPQAAAIIVHDDYFSLFSQWLFLVDDEQQAKCHPNFIGEDGEGAKDKCTPLSIFTDLDSISDLRKSSLPIKIKDNIDFLSSSGQLKHGSHNLLGFWSLVEIAEKLVRTLPVYHPEALLMNLYSGILG